MAVPQEIKDWWAKTLLGEQMAAHPVFGNDVRVEARDGVVTLRGTVEDADQAQELEREARSINAVRDVINHLTVLKTGEKYHLQTVIAAFPDCDSAELASRQIESWTFHEDRPGAILQSVDDTRERLEKRARAAWVPPESIKRYVDAVKQGKTLLVERVPEDDALRVISALEGSSAEWIQTLPPEPESLAS